MRIQLQESDNIVWLPLPPPVAHQAGFKGGDEVEVLYDPERGQITLRRSVGDEASAPSDVAGAFEEFLTRYRDALTELAGV
jgi:hypothetical protein